LAIAAAVLIAASCAQNPPAESVAALPPPPPPGLIKDVAAEKPADPAMVREKAPLPKAAVVKEKLPPAKTVAASAGEAANVKDKAAAKDKDKAVAKEKTVSAKSKGRCDAPSPETCSSGCIWIHPYTRENGTAVKGHCKPI
jgi:hypothetical protein